MPKSIRTGVVAGVAAMLALSLLSVAPASAAAHPVVGRDHAHARAVAALQAVRTALSVRPPATTPRADLSLLLRDLRLALPDLTASERSSASALLGLTVPPPSASCGGGLFNKVIQSTHFCVHYSGDAAWAQTTADTLESVWAAEIGRLHFRAPPADADGLFDVYLRDIGGQGYYGACAPAESSRHSTSSCVLDDDFSPAQFGGAAPINSLRVTAAHEFFHAVQYAYDTDEDIWLMEGSAVWAEEQVYPSINDYLQYLPFSTIPHPRTPIDYKGITSTDLFYRYGAVLFWKFLSEQFGTPAIVRRVWELSDGPLHSMQAVATALAERGWTFGKAFARFGVWNTEPKGTYDDRRLYPTPAWWQVRKLTRRHKDTGAHTVTLDHLTNAAAYLRPGKLPKGAKLRIKVSGPALVHQPRATVQLRRRDGSLKIIGIKLDAAGDGSTRVVFDPRRITAVVVTVTNASIRMTCQADPDDRYWCGGLSPDDGQKFTVRARVRLP